MILASCDPIFDGTTIDVGDLPIKNAADVPVRLRYNAPMSASSHRIKPYYAWKTIEQWAFNSGLLVDPVQTRKARLMLFTCLASGSACAALIIFGQFERPEQWLGNMVVAIGHFTTCASFLLLRWFPTMRVPSAVMLVFANVQLLNAAWWSGGPDSSVLFAFPIAPVFMGLIGQRFHSVATAVTLSLGVAGIYYVSDWGFAFGTGPASTTVLVATMIWSIFTGAGIAVYTQYQTNHLLNDAANEVHHRRIAQEEAEQANREKDMFMAYLSHEIRNPLAVIMSSLEMLRIAENHQHERYQDAAMTATKGLSQLLNDVVDVVALKRNRLRVESEPFELTSVVNQLVDQYSIAAERKGLSLSISQPNAIQVLGDRTRMIQVLNNLIGNAVKYTAAGTISVHVQAENDTVTITVVDTGPGIPFDRRSQIFQPFERVRVGDTPGSGLGLAVSRALLQRMDSDLHLECPTIGGCRFWFSLPRCASNTSGVQAASPPI